MLKLTPNDIQLHQSASDKFAAITQLAHDLNTKQLVNDDYVTGMLNREKQHSTFLGNGIAIPHGTVETRSSVKKTGVTVHHYPDGIDWADGNQVYVAIGIAAQSDEHLGILKQLTKVLAVDGIEDLLKKSQSKTEIIAILNGDTQVEADFDASLIQTHFPASDMLQMAAVAGGLLKNTGCADHHLVADFVSKKPTHLGKGLWMIGSDKGVSRTALSFVSTTHQCEYQNLPVKGLIAFAACNNVHQPIMALLAQLVFENRQEDILTADATTLINIVKGQEVLALNTSDTASGEFIIKNTHGLHARPGAMLVAETKKFDAKIQVRNTSNESATVNAKSLMKVIGLGVKHGQTLHFTAQGVDAQQAIDAIEQAIQSGLGEG